MLASTPSTVHTRLRLIAVGLLVSFLSACTTTPAPKPVEPDHPITPLSPPPAPVVRYGSYTLVEIEPTAAQADLLGQIIDVTVPPAWSASVGEAIRYILLRSISMCFPFPPLTSTLAPSRCARPCDYWPVRRGNFRSTTRRDASATPDAPRS
jgi:hypothetical protein